MVQESRNVYKGIKWYFNKRNGYKKLHGTSERMHPCVEVMGSSGNAKKRRFNFRMKLNKKLKLKFKFSMSSPKKMLIGFRDGYINLMNKIASSSMVTGGGFIGGGGDGGGGDGGGGGYGGNNVMNEIGVKRMKEYDEKMIVEIYKSLVINQTQLVPSCDVAKFGRHVICSRAH